MMSITTLTKKAYELHTAVSQDYDLVSAEKCSNVLYEEGIKRIQLAVDQGAQSIIPLAATLKLIEVLTLDSIQLEDNFKLSISKVCRVFMELVFFESILAQRQIYQETKDKVTQLFKMVLKTIPEKEVTTRFNIRCCKEALKGCDTGDGLIVRHGPAIVDILGNSISKPGKAIGKGLETLKKLYEELGTSWYPTVWHIHWLGTKATNSEDMEEIYKLYNGYKNDKNAMLGLIEALATVIRTSSESSLKDALVIHETDENKPGLMFFVKKIETRPLNKLVEFKDTYWKVRFCALQILKKLIIEGAISDIYVRILAHQIKVDKNPHNALLLKDCQELLKQHKAHWKREALTAEDFEKLMQENSRENDELEKVYVEEKAQVEDQKKGKKSLLEVSGQERIPLKPEELQKLEEKEKQLYKNKLRIEQGLKGQRENLAMLREILAMQN